MFYTTEVNDHGLKYNPFKAIVAPRPIAWISTIDNEGRSNLAPYSFFNGMRGHRHDSWVRSRQLSGCYHPDVVILRLTGLRECFRLGVFI